MNSSQIGNEIQNKNNCLKTEEVTGKNNKAGIKKDENGFIRTVRNAIRRTKQKGA